MFRDTLIETALTVYLDEACICVSLCAGNIPLLTLGKMWRDGLVATGPLATHLASSRLNLRALDFTLKDGSSFLHLVFGKKSFSGYHRYRRSSNCERLVTSLTNNTKKLLPEVDLLAMDDRGYSVIALMRAEQAAPRYYWRRAPVVDTYGRQVVALFQRWQVARGEATGSDHSATHSNRRLSAACDEGLSMLVCACVRLPTENSSASI